MQRIPGGAGARSIGQEPEGWLMKVAYIVGLGRSGSTLLDLMLNAHSGVFTVGEVKALAQYAHLRKPVYRKPRGHWTNGNRCTCGTETIWDCAFWSAVNDRLGEQYGVSLADLDVQSRDRNRFERDNLCLFQAVGEESGASVVVDSSKGLTRLKRLMATPGLEVVPIHMVRDPRGRANSVRKDRNKVLATAIQYDYNAFRIAWELWGTSHAMIRYEDLVGDPERELRRLMQTLDLDFEAGQLEWAGPESHNLAGNRMRRGSESQLKLDLSWQTELSPMQRGLVGILASPGRGINHAKEKRMAAERGGSDKSE